MIKIKPKVEEYMDGPIFGGMSGKKKEPKKIYPSISLRHEFIPETKEWEVGKTYKILLEVKMTGLSISKMQNDSEFDITGYEIANITGNPGKVKEDKEEKKESYKENKDSPAVPEL